MAAPNIACLACASIATLLAFDSLLKIVMIIYIIDAFD